MSAELLRAALVATGDELLSGGTADANSPYCARRLGELGFDVVRAVIVGDDEEPLAAAVTEALALAGAGGVVVLSGGLGPTLDDQTRHAVARAAGVELEHSAQAWAEIERWWAARPQPIPAANRRQALMPRGAQVLPNAVGTAPGFALAIGAARVFALPGPPFEMRAMFEAEVVPRLARAAAAGVQRIRRFHMFGLSESVFADEVGPWMERSANPLLGCSVKDGILTASLRARGADAAEAERLLDARSAELRARFARYLFSEGEARVEEVVGKLLIDRGLTVSAAESCTAGLCAAMLGRVPGISAVLGASFVVYSDAAKEALLGVPRALLNAHGAVSEPVAAAMAAGAAERAGARAAIAISGIAGPSGGTPEKPVGMVCFATALLGSSRALDVRTHTRRFPPTARDHIRAVAARTGLLLLWRRIARPEVSD